MVAVAVESVEASVVLVVLLIVIVIVAIVVVVEPVNKTAVIVTAVVGLNIYIFFNIFIWNAHNSWCILYATDASADEFTAIPLQGSGTYSVESVLQSTVPRTSDSRVRSTVHHCDLIYIMWILVYGHLLAVDNPPPPVTDSILSL